MLPKIKESDILKAPRISKKISKSKIKHYAFADIKDERDMNCKSTEKIKIPKSLVMHRKNKSNDYCNIGRFELPSVNEVLVRILNNTASPHKERSDSREECLLLIPKIHSNLSPSKIAIAKKRNPYLAQKNHFRSASPLKQFNDRIFHLKRMIGK